jgi:hypothetical protein
LKIAINSQAIVLQEYLIKGISQPRIPDTRFFFITKYPPLDNSDLLIHIFNTDSRRRKSREFLDHIVWALRFHSIFPPSTSEELSHAKTDNSIEGLLNSLKKSDGDKEAEFPFCYKYLPIYYLGFSDIWKSVKKNERKKAFRDYARLWDKDDFNTVRLWSSFVYELVLNKVNLYIYKKLHNQITHAERRLFLLSYTRTPLLGYRILNQNPIIKGFLKLPEVAKLCYYYFIHRIDKIDSRNIPEFLSECYRSYLRSGSTHADIENKIQHPQQTVNLRIWTAKDKIKERTFLADYRSGELEKAEGRYPRRELVNLLENLTGTLEGGPSTTFGQIA